MGFDVTRRHALSLLGTGTTLSVIPLAGCVGDLFEEQTADIEIEDDRFNPCEVELAIDGIVTWENVSNETHTITSASPNWNIDVEIGPEEVTSYEFATEGVYLAVSTTAGDPDDFEGMRMAIAIGDAEIEDELDEPIDC